jgi:lysophospholipase L1-like esterase
MNRKNFIHRSTLFAIGAVAGNRVFANNRTGVVTATAPSLIINAGVNGNTTTNLLKRIDTDCLVHKPELVIMMVGTNDMNNGKFVAPDKYKTNLEQLSDKILESGSKLLMMSILPFYEPYLLTRHPAEFFQPEGPAGRRTQVNAIIKSVAEKKKASFLDIGILFEKVGKIGLEPDSLLRNEANVGKTDGVHPTQNGYRFLALAVYQHIIYNNLPTGRIVCFGDSITKGDGSVDKESYPAYLNKLLS